MFQLRTPKTQNMFPEDLTLPTTAPIKSANGKFFRIFNQSLLPLKVQQINLPKASHSLLIAYTCIWTYIIWIFCPNRASGESAGNINAIWNEELISERAPIIHDMGRKVNFGYVKMTPLFFRKIHKNIFAHMCILTYLLFHLSYVQRINCQFLRILLNKKKSTKTGECLWFFQRKSVSQNHQKTSLS